MTLEVIEGDVFNVALPCGEARLVYADPPYFREDRHGYGTWPDTDRLITRMCELGADDCSYILFCGEHNLGYVLAAVEKLAPTRKRSYPGQPKARTLCWTKPWNRNGLVRRNVAWRSMWEPIVTWHGPAYRTPPNLCETDWICALRNERSLNGHATQKPEELLEWLFTRELAAAQGRLAIDLFAGTGGAAIMADRMGLDAIAVENDPLFAEKIHENHMNPAPRPSWKPSVETDLHGRPVWPTFGALDADLVAELQEVTADGHDRRSERVG